VIPEVLFVHNGDADKLVTVTKSLIENPQALAAQVAGFRDIRALMEKGAPEAPLQNPVDKIIGYLPA
jgi:lipid-A-disaccharide synthase